MIFCIDTVGSDRYHGGELMVGYRMSRNDFHSKLLAWGLFVALVVVSGTAGTAVAHDLHHGTHHSAKLHGTGICAWMCAAGDGMQALFPCVVGESLPVATVAPAALPEAPSGPTSVPATRAPPASSF